jgi:hypothetical protein
MIAGAEVVLFVVGLYALIAGKLPTSKNGKRAVRGLPARVIGVICLLPLPLAFLVCAAVAAVLIAQGQEVTPQSFMWVGMVIEASIVVLCVVAAVILQRVYQTPVEQSLPQEARA